MSGSLLHFPFMVVLHPLLSVFTKIPKSRLVVFFVLLFVDNQVSAVTLYAFNRWILAHQ